MVKAFVGAFLTVFAFAAVPSFGADDSAKPSGKDNTPPEGYVALFNGKDLTGWKGLLKAPNDNPLIRAKLSPEEHAKLQKESDENMREHWKVEDGVIVYDGKGRSLCTSKDYGNFEMYCDWKIEKGGDSGIYLRGVPQVQIWDPANKPAGGVGSGGLYNNKHHPDKPTKTADKPVGEWNTFWIKMVGDKVWVKLNGELVVDGVPLENEYFAGQAKMPGAPVPATGQIELQNHTSPLYFKNIYIKELPAEK
jgi:hypothetical protein